MTKSVYIIQNRIPTLNIIERMDYSDTVSNLGPFRFTVMAQHNHDLWKLSCRSIFFVAFVFSKSLR